MQEKLNISIAMCTYNGEKYLQEQLDSFLNQTRIPDEVVVCDDGSRDGTVGILQAFAAQAPFPVRIFINPENLGYAKNFEKAISLCRGDLIALSDQDDIWLSEKLKEVEKVYLQHPSIGLVVTNAYIMGENLNLLDDSLWDRYGFFPNSIRHFLPGELTEFCFDHTFLGFTMVLTAKLRDYLLPIPSSSSHDFWISFIGSACCEVAAIPMKLNKYRRHQGQLFGVPISFIAKYQKSKEFQRSYYVTSAMMWREVLSFLRSNPMLNIDRSIVKHINAKIDHLEIRANMKGNLIKRFPVILNEIVNNRYHRYSNGWNSILKDLIF